MIKNFLVILVAFSATTVFSQQNDTLTNRKLLKELADNACKCVDSVDTYDKSKNTVTKDLHGCIDKQIAAYQIGSKLVGAASSITTAANNETKKVDLFINTDKDSREYKKYYYEMEAYMMDNCPVLKTKVAIADKLSSKSMSANPEAVEFYLMGIKEVNKENYKPAIGYFEKALKVDLNFAFAWDNIGICYRKLGELDKALNAYKKSLELDPAGQMPLQNIPIVYLYKKDYANAINAYEKLASVDDRNPEVFYGIGQICVMYLKDYEKGLSNLCKAYNLYIEQKSPYRTDAEKLINMAYAEMKKQGKETRFAEILKEHKINTQ